MSSPERLRAQLLEAKNGPTSIERQAQARVRTNVYLANIDKRDPNKAALLAGYKDTEVDLQTKLAEETANGDTVLVEIYAAALRVFTEFNGPVDA